MKRVLRHRGRLLLAGAVVGALAVAGGVALAAIPDSGGHVHACYKTSDASKAGGAALSVIDTEAGAAKCKSGQSELTLLQQGLVTGDVEGAGTSGFQGTSFGSFQARVSTEKATKLFVTGRFSIGVHCNSTPCGRSLALAVDGVVADHTVVGFPGGTTTVTTRDTVFDIVSVPAGDHVIEAYGRNFGDIESSTNDITVGAITLGG